MEHRRTLPRAWYSFVAFLGAFLLFQLELITGQAVLPVYGGGYQVWTACLLFFQGALLLGYLYAREAPRRLTHGRSLKLHLALLVLAAALMPARLPEGAWLAAPAADLVLRLFIFMGAPFFLLSATSTLAQQAYARTPGASSPYEIYGWSNAGSAAGLLAYPFGFALAFGLETNYGIWRALFAAFALAMIPVTAEARGDRRAEAVVPPAGETPGRALWALLPATSAAALVAATNYINTIAAPMPLTWTLPLLAYLLSFIVYFVENRFAPRALPAALLAVLAGAGALAMSDAPQGVAIVLGVNALLLLACLLLHRELHARKPAPALLPDYYLAIAAGGFAGTALISLVLPVLGRSVFARYADLDAALALFAASAAYLYSPRLAVGWRKYAVAAAVLGAAVFISNREAPGASNVYSLRNFYGVYQIRDDRASSLRTMTHGGTPHGVQSLEEGRRRTPLSYYGANSPVAGAFRLRPGAAVGVVGLGVGDLLSYARKGENWTVFEIDPDVVAMAREHFSFMADSPAPVRVVTGDSRVTLAREPSRSYDLLILDAFDGANVPFHLLTWEALALYRTRLKPGGVLLVHCSSNHFALRPVLAAGAAAARMSGWSKDSEPVEEGLGGGGGGLRASEWFAATSDPAAMARLKASGWSRLAPDGRDLWTDGYKNVLRAMRYRPES